MRKVKITVLRKEFYEDLAEEYLTEGAQTGSCVLLNVASGSTFTPWNRADNQTIVCCTDGIRPVVFKVEAMEDEK